MIFTGAISILALVAAALYRREHRRRILAEHALTDATAALDAQSEVMQQMMQDMQEAGVVRETRLVLPKRTWS